MAITWETSGEPGHLGNVAAEKVQLQVCLVEPEAKVRRQIANAIREAGHTVLLSSGPLDLLRRQRKGIEPDVLVGSAAFIEGIAVMGPHTLSAPALLLARPEDSAYLRIFMGRNPANEFMMLPQSDEAVRFCVANFLRRQEWSRPARKSNFGSYRFVQERYEVAIGGKTVALSPAKFALAEVLFTHANTQLSSADIYKKTFGGEREDVLRLIDSNIALLSHLLELDGSHGYFLKRPAPDSYCLKSVLPFDLFLERADLLDDPHRGGLPAAGGGHLGREH